MEPKEPADALFGAASFDAAHFGGGLDADLGAEQLTTHALSLEEDDDGIERTAASARSLPVRPRAPERHWPTGTSPDSASIELDAAELAMTSDYGLAPTSYVGALSYAFRVLKRKRVLRARINALDESLLSAERERDDLLIAMVEAQRLELQHSPEGRRVLESLGRIEALANEKRTQLTGVNTEFQKHATGLDEETAALAEEHARNLRDVELARSVLAERQHAFDRVEARKKRLYIEVRGVLDAVEKGGGAPTPPQAAQIAAREAEIAAQKPELSQAENELELAKASVASAEAVGKELQRRGRDVERRRAALAAEARKQIGAHSRGVNEAEAHRSEAVTDAARAVLAARGRVVDVPAATLDGIERADATVAARARELERHVRALDAHDVDAMKKGLVAASAIVFAAILLLGFLAR
jgi:hypothetical protein